MFSIEVALTSAEAAKILGVKLPQLSGVDVDSQMKSWKDGPLKTAWREQARKSHPDLNAGVDVSFKEVSEAYMVLRGLQLPEVDPILKALRRAGILDRNLNHLQEIGELDRIRVDNPDKLTMHIRDLQKKQRLGQLAPRAGWPR